ncbi:MAG TPA: efflux RND transporter periplasmic adaptor subunit [Candidatus Acidoferrum sp.]|nr:efflux RND transporter periplasmic adaptor subunit [Candidatus Acidoferrum sp.]
MRKYVIAGLSGLVILNSGCGTKHAAADVGMAKAVHAITVKTQDSSTTATYSAVVVPAAQADLAFRVSGYVTELQRWKARDGRMRPLEPGVRVASGMMLARLRRMEYEAVADKAAGSREEADAGVHAAEAQVAEAQAGVTEADLDFARVEKLWEQESITKPAYDASKAKLDMGHAKFDGATSALAAARKRASSAAAQFQEAHIALEDTELRAPFDGILLERKVDVGALVSAGMPVFTVADLRHVKARFNVPDSALGDFRLGQNLGVTVDAFRDQTFHGSVISIAASADPTVRSFQVELSIANPDLQLRSGMIASVLASGNRTDHVVEVPTDALVHDPIRNRYLVYGTEQRDNFGQRVAREIVVRPGPLAGSSVLILEGLNPGQRIVGSGANLLRNGDRIREID